MRIDFYEINFRPSLKFPSRPNSLSFAQLAAAIEFIHIQNLVHRDIKLDNILVFKSDFSRIKLCDLGETRKINAMVRRRNEWLPYSPPEVLATDTDKTYRYEFKT